jgi:hypothetical protein
LEAGYFNDWKLNIRRHFWEGRKNTQEPNPNILLDHLKEYRKEDGQKSILTDIRMSDERL